MPWTSYERPIESRSSAGGHCETRRACRAWLLRVVHNVAIDEIGRTRRLVALEGDGFEVPDLRMLADAFRGVAASLTLEHLQRLLG